MNTNIKALSNEELELVSGGADAGKIVGKVLLFVTLVAGAIFVGKFANDVYKESTGGYGWNDFKKKLEHGDNLYDKAVRETANLFKKQ